MALKKVCFKNGKRKRKQKGCDNNLKKDIINTAEVVHFLTALTLLLLKYCIMMTVDVRANI